MKKKKIISITAMSLVLGSTILTANASSTGVARGRLLRQSAGFTEVRSGGPGGRCATRQQEQAIEAAIAKGDFAAWRSAMSDIDSEGALADALTRENFTIVVEAYGLEQNGDIDGAMELLRDSGLPMGLDMRAMRSGGGLDLAQEDRAALSQALENADYGAWKAVMEKADDDKTAGLLTEEKFNLIVRAYRLEKSGDVSGAMTLLRNSGIPGYMLMLGRLKGLGQGRPAEDVNSEELTNAYLSGDYAAWKALMEQRGGGMILALVNADNFTRFAEAKLLQAAGDHEAARALLEELGFPFMDRGGRPEKPAAEN